MTHVVRRSVISLILFLALLPGNILFAQPQSPQIQIDRRLAVKQGAIALKRVVLDNPGYVVILKSNKPNPEEVIGKSILLKADETQNIVILLDGRKVKKVAWAQLFYDDGDGYFDRGDLKKLVSGKKAKKRFLLKFKPEELQPAPPFFPPEELEPKTEANTLSVDEIMKNYPPPGEFPFSEKDAASFFEGDEQAQMILAGKAVFDMRSTQDDFREKILNALRMLGVINLPSQNCRNPEVDIQTLCQFQRRHGIPESNLIDQRTLTMLNEEIAIIEKHDREIAKNFLCYEYLVPAPKNGPSKDHLAALYATAFNAFPVKHRVVNKKQCLDAQVVTTGVSKNPWEPPRICSPAYWPEYNDRCELKEVPPPQTTSSGLPPPPRVRPIDDYQFVATIIHEYAHLLDVYKSGLEHLTVPEPNSIDARKFYDISYDSESTLVLENLSRVAKPHVTIPSSLPSDHPEWNPVRKHFFSYGIGWEFQKHPGYYTVAEDFATNVSMYMLHGKVFRDYMRDKPPLQQKYLWLKNNMFEGKEYETGDPNYAAYAPDLYFPPGGAFDVTGFVKNRPDDFLWGNAIPEPVVLR